LVIAMEKLTFQFETIRIAGGERKQAIIGVVASGNLEVLIERTLPPGQCHIEIATAAHGFGPVWQAVLSDFIARRAAGGLKISINDGGARPDTVALRLAQGVRMIEQQS
jgi:malonate decarboxylase delta subunit